jgi:hypothetical protein
MTNFVGLNNLDSILGGISIHATNLIDFTGLESLKQIGNNDGYNYEYNSINSNIEDFTGLDSLQKWYGTINIHSGFSSFEGLDMLNEVGELNLTYCNNLINFEGLNTLTKAKAIKVIIV